MVARATALLVSILLLGVVPAAPAAAAALPGDGSCGARVPDAPFEDVDDDELLAAVGCMAFRGILEGTSYATYEPEGLTTRGALGELVGRAVVAAGGELPRPGDAFDDVEGPFRSTIESLAAAGVLEGVARRSFEPTEPMTRGELAQVFARAQRLATGRNLPVSGDRFRDDDGSPYEQSIDALAAAGIVGGFGDGSFRPAGTVTRGQAALYLGRWFTTLVDAGTIPTARPPTDHHDAPAGDGTAYETGGAAWPLPVRYAFGDGIGPLRRAAVERAMATWSAALDVDAAFVADQDAPDLVLDMVVGCEGARVWDLPCLDGGGEVSGNALSQSTVGSAPVRHAIHLDGTAPWTTGRDARADVESVALHALGHVLGLGHSDNDDAAMHATYAGVRRTAATADVRALLALYRAEPEEPSSPPVEEVPVAGQARVTAAAGASAQGAPGCSSSACRYLDITAVGLVPGDVVRVRCETRDGTWSVFGVSEAVVDARGRVEDSSCYFGYPGREVRARVAGVVSRPVTWPAG